MTALGCLSYLPACLPYPPTVLYSTFPGYCARSFVPASSLRAPLPPSPFPPLPVESSNALTNPTQVTCSLPSPSSALQCLYLQVVLSVIDGSKARRSWEACPLRDTYLSHSNEKLLRLVCPRSSLAASRLRRAPLQLEGITFHHVAGPFLPSPPATHRVPGLPASPVASLFALSLITTPVGGVSFLPSSLSLSSPAGSIGLC